MTGVTGVLSSAVGAVANTTRTVTDLASVIGALVGRKLLAGKTLN